MTPKAQRRKEKFEKKLQDKDFLNNLSYDHSNDKINDEEDTRSRVD